MRRVVFVAMMAVGYSGEVSAQDAAAGEKVFGAVHKPVYGRGTLSYFPLTEPGWRASKNS